MSKDIPEAGEIWKSKDGNIPVRIVHTDDDFVVFAFYCVDIDWRMHVDGFLTNYDLEDSSQEDSDASK